MPGEILGGIDYPYNTDVGNILSVNGFYTSMSLWCVTLLRLPTPSRLLYSRLYNSRLYNVPYLNTQDAKDDEKCTTYEYNVADGLQG